MNVSRKSFLSTVLGALGITTAAEAQSTHPLLVASTDTAWSSYVVPANGQCPCCYTMYKPYTPADAERLGYPKPSPDSAVAVRFKRLAAFPPEDIHKGDSDSITCSVCRNVYTVWWDGYYE